MHLQSCCFANIGPVYMEVGVIPPSRGALCQDYWMVAKHVNKKKGRQTTFFFFFITALPHSLAALAATFSAVAFYIVTVNNAAKPPPKPIVREYDVLRIRPRLGGLPHLEMFTWQNLTPPWRVTPPIMYPSWVPALGASISLISPSSQPFPTKIAFAEYFSRLLSNIWSYVTCWVTEAGFELLPIIIIVIIIIIIK